MFEACQVVIIFIIAAMGGFIQRVTGFGFGIFVMLFLPHIMKTHTSAAAISTLVSCFISVYNAVLYRKDVPYKKIIPLIMAALVTIPVAVHFSVMITGDFFKKALGIVLIGLSIYFLFFNKQNRGGSKAFNAIIQQGNGA